MSRTIANDPVAPPLLAWLDRRPLLACALIFLAFVASRGIRIAEDPFWLDEAWTVSLTHASVAGVLDTSLRDQNPPAYNLVIGGWARLFGRSEAGVRSFSLLAAALTGVALFLLARSAFSVEVALWSVALLLSSSMAFQYALEARSYALVGFLCVVSYALYFRLFTRPTFAGAALLAIVNAAAVYAHYTVAFAFLVQLAAAWLLARSRRALVLYLASQAFAFVLFLPWLPAMLRNAPQPGVYWLGSPIPRDLATAYWVLAGGRYSLLLGSATIAIGALALVRAASPRFDLPRVVTVAAWGLLSPLVCFAVAQWTPIFYPRYLLFIVPALTLLAAVAVASLPVGFAWRACVAAALVAAGIAGLDSGRIVKPDWPGASRRAREASTASSRILIAPNSECLPFTYYFAPERFGPIHGFRRRLRKIGVLCGDYDATLERAFSGTAGDRMIVITSARARSDEITKAAEKHGYRKLEPVKRVGLTLTIYER